MKKLIALTIMILSAPPALAEEQAKPPQPPPETKKTVDAWVGKWTFDGTLTGMPGTDGPIKVKEVFACKKAGGGRVVSCTGKANVPKLGKLEDEALITWDAGMGAIRFVGMSSMGDVHDHKCSWKDDKTMACEPLAVTIEGQPATVSLDVAWADAKNITLNETTTMKDGSKVVFDGKAKR